jgi:hypothetical protein
MDNSSCRYLEQVGCHALQSISSSEASEMREHLNTCRVCREELESLRPVVGAFASWPTVLLRPAESVWERVAQRIGLDTRTEAPSDFVELGREPAWKDVAPGIACKLLAADTERHRISMLVRLAPGAEYPPHRHAGLEELHLLQGELWIDDRKLYPGDYNRAERGTADRRVWSETGCTCVLMTSTQDVLS